MYYKDPIYEIYPEYDDAPYASPELIHEITELAKTNRVIMTEHHEAKLIMDKFSRKPIVEFASAYFSGNIQVAGVSVIKDGKYHRFKVLSGGKELYCIINDRLHNQDKPDFPYANDALAEFVAENRKEPMSYAQKLAHYAQYHYVKFEKSDDKFYEFKATIYTNESGLKCAEFYHTGPCNNQVNCLENWLLKTKTRNSKDEMVSVFVNDSEAMELYRTLSKRNHVLYSQIEQNNKNQRIK